MTDPIRQRQRGLRFLAAVDRIVLSTRVRAILSIGLLLGLVSVGTMAKWSDTAAATSGAISTGTINILANEVKNTTLAMAKSDMQRGDSVSGNVVVANRGTVPLSYTMSVTGNGTLSPYLRLSVAPGTAGNCGTTLATTTPANGTATNVNTAARTLAAQSTDPLCLTVQLDPNAAASAGGAQATLTVIFSANSVAP